MPTEKSSPFAACTPATSQTAPAKPPEHHVMIGQVSSDPVETVRDRRAGRTARGIIGAKHEMINQQLRASAKEVCQRRAPFIRLELVLLVEPDPRQFLTFSRQLIAASR